MRNPVPGFCKFQSVRFAANDLWGDGYGVGATIGGNGLSSISNNVYIRIIDMM